jgi:hypothetical protein
VTEVSGRVPGEAEKWDDVIRKITSVWTPEVAAEVLAAITQLDFRASASVGYVPTFDGSKFVPQPPTIAAAEVTFTETTGAGTYTGSNVVADVVATADGYYAATGGQASGWTTPQ